MEDLLNSWAWLAPIFLPPIVTGMVQIAKNKGANPMIALGSFSVLVSMIYVAIMNYTPQEVLDDAVTLLISVAGGASLLYSLLRGYLPSLLK